MYLTKSHLTVICNNLLSPHWAQCYTENDSPQPQVPDMLGLLKTNSEASLDSWKSISVPKIDNCAFLSI